MKKRTERLMKKLSAPLRSIFIPSFNVSDAEGQLIVKIAHRAYDMQKQRRIYINARDLEMDLTATHANGCPLDLEKFLGAPDFDFLHDVFGIQDHIDRRTGKLLNCFLPRCAR